jgi:hypothetical protein
MSRSSSLPPLLPRYLSRRLVRHNFSDGGSPASVGEDGSEARSWGERRHHLRNPCNNWLLSALQYHNIIQECMIHWSKPVPECPTCPTRHPYPQLQTIHSVIIPRSAPSFACPIIALARRRSTWLLTAIIGSELARFRQVAPPPKQSPKPDSKSTSAYTIRSFVANVTRPEQLP